MLSEKRKSKKQAKEEILRKANSNKKRRELKKINQFKKALRTASSQNKGSMPSKLSKWLDEIIMTTTTTEPTEPMAGATDDNDATASNGEEGDTHAPPTDNEANDDTPSSVGDAPSSGVGNDAPSDIGAGNNNDAPSDSGADGNGGDEDDNPNDDDDDDANDANDANANEADTEDETSSSCIDRLTKCLKYFSIGSLCNCCKFEDAEGMAGEYSDSGLDSDSELDDDELDEHVSSLIVPNYL